MKLDVVIIGLSVTSSWGNGHATTYRALIEALVRRGHSVTFLERDVEWYRSNRDLAQPLGWSVHLYESPADLAARFADTVRDADVVIVGSYVPDGIEIGRWVTEQTLGVAAFYDIDTPVTLAGLAQGLAYLSAELIPLYDLYLTFTGGSVPRLLESRYGSPMARPLYCSADLDLYRPRPAELRWKLGYLGTYSDDRQPVLDELLLAPARALGSESFVVAGPQYPHDLVWPPNVDRIEHLPPRDHAAFYCAQSFTLNVTRADMKALGYSPSVRIFEAAACGAPVISDIWDGIETLLEPSREILLVNDARDVMEILSTMTEDRRRTIAEGARRRIVAEHSPDHRARELEDHVVEARDAKGARRGEASARRNRAEMAGGEANAAGTQNP